MRARATRRGHSVVYDERSGNFIRRSGVDWRSDYDGGLAMANAPVMHVSIRDAENYASWLSEQTGRSYRLPSEAEFEYALRAGGSGRYPWGAAGAAARCWQLHWQQGCLAIGTALAQRLHRLWRWLVGPAPVASFQANAFGLHDMAGNLEVGGRLLACQLPARPPMARPGSTGCRAR